MVSNLDELKALIIWAKSQKLKSLRLGDTQFEFSELSFIPDEPAYSESDLAKDLSVAPAMSLRELEALSQG